VEASDSPDRATISYALFGTRFFQHAVTEPRVVAALDDLVGRQIEFGPISVGGARRSGRRRSPLAGVLDIGEAVGLGALGGLARVSGTGEIGRPTAERQLVEPITFRLLIPIALALSVDLGIDLQRFTASVEARLKITARAADPLLIVFDVDAPRAEDVTVAVQAQHLRGSVLGRLAGIDREIARSVAANIERRLADPERRRAREIDVASLIDRAAPAPPAAPAPEASAAPEQTEAPGAPEALEAPEAPAATGGDEPA
jgi:hypothetical protein